MCTIDEAQNLFAHPKYGKAAGLDAEFIIKIGPAFGVILIIATQRPDKASLPTGVSGNVSDRFCLKVTGQVENDMILGTSAYKNGIRATTFCARRSTPGSATTSAARSRRSSARSTSTCPPPSGSPPVPASCARPRARCPASPSADDAEEAARDVLADLAAVFGGDAGLHWAEAAARLGQRFPDRWAGAERRGRQRRSTRTRRAERERQSWRDAGARLPPGRCDGGRRWLLRRRAATFAYPPPTCAVGAGA